MDEYIYFWPQHDAYCYREDLEDFASMYGHNYECWKTKEFYDTIGSDLARM